jgi:hypothetical protein
MTTDTIASSTSPLFEKAEPSAYFSDQDYHRFHERAARYDRENRFFDEDLADLRERACRSNELERLYRDVRTGSLHPPNTDAILDVIGKFAVRVLP